MEIVQVAGLYPPHLGGEEIVAERLARLQAETHDVTVYTTDIGARGAPRRDRHGRLRIFRDRAWRIANTPVVPGLLGRLLRHRPRPDIVHVHAGLALTPEIVRIATRLRAVPYVAHVHLMVRPSSPAGRLLLPIYQRALYGRFLRRAARVICLTEAMLDEVVHTFGVRRNRVVIVPNGVDGTLFHPAGPTGRGCRELLFVGRLTAQKNVTLAVEAMAALPRDVSLLIVGTGELRPAIERRVAELGLTRVRLLGRLTQAELAQRYRRATAVLMPSTHEGLPLVLLEAMSAGAPVVCSALPELIEIGGDAVVAVEPMTAATLAAAARALLDDPERRDRLSRAAHERVARYAWPAVAAAVDAVYEQIRAERR